MIKSLLPEVAKVVGKSSALLLNQIALLFKSFSNGNKVYRTNKDLYSDLEGLLSESTIKRCKQKLVASGYLTISFDKGLNRQTYFSLTNKSIDLLKDFIPDIEKYISDEKQNKNAVLDKSPKDITKVETTKSKKLKVNEHANASSPQMVKSFDDGFDNPNAVPIDEVVHHINVKSFSDLIKEQKKKEVNVSGKSQIFKDKLMLKNSVKEDNFDEDLKYQSDLEEMIELKKGESLGNV